jgi:sigma-E factor negative regulatory protein RseA
MRTRPEPIMTTTPDPRYADPRQWISDLMDGRLDEAAIGHGCERWQAEAESRRTWHAYQLIGDVMRSEDLASDPGRDAAFLAALRGRLADEPVVLAPAAPRPRRQVWMLPVAVAAGVVAVAGVLVVLQQPQAGGAAGPMLAASPPPAAAPGAVAVSVPDAQMLRDARVDEYLRAHRETLAGTPAALPGGALRSVDFAVPQR